MDYILIILKRDIKSLLTPDGKAGLKQRVRIVLAVLVMAGLAVGFGYGAFRLFDFLRTHLGVAPELRRAVEINVLNGAAMFVFTMVVLMGFQTTYKIIYESDDVGFLLAQPVPAWSVFGAKFLASYAVLVVMTLGYGLPVWVAFGYVRGLGPGFYVSAALGFLALLLASHAAVTLLLLIAMRYLPGRKMKQLFIALSAIFGILIVFVSQMLSARLSRSGDPMVMIEQLGKGGLSAMRYFPTTWMARGILGSVPEFGVRAASGWLPLLFTAFGGSYAAMALSGRWYLHGWSGRAEELGAGKTRRKKTGTRQGRTTGRRLQGPYWAVLSKDLRMLWRDPVLWYTLAVSAIGLGFFVYNISSSMGPASGAARDSGAGIVSVLMVVMPAFMGSVASAQTGGVSLSREGKSFWFLRSAPLDARRLLAAKFSYALLPQAVFVLAFNALIAFTDLPRNPMWLNLLLGSFSAIGIASMQMLLDVYFPDFSLKVELGSGSGGKGTVKLLSAMFGSMGMAAVIGLVLSLPKILSKRWAAPVATLDALSYLFVAAAGAALAAILFGPGVRRLSRMLTDM